MSERNDESIRRSDSLLFNSLVARLDRTSAGSISRIRRALFNQPEISPRPHDSTVPVKLGESFALSPSLLFDGTLVFAISPLFPRIVSRKSHEKKHELEFGVDLGCKGRRFLNADRPLSCADLEKEVQRSAFFRNLAILKLRINADFVGTRKKRYISLCQIAAILKGAG